MVKKEFIKKIEKALMLKDNPEYIRLFNEQAKENTREARASELERAIEGCKSKKGTNRR